MSSSSFFFHSYGSPRDLHSFPTRRSSDLVSLVTRQSAAPPSYGPRTRAKRWGLDGSAARRENYGTFHWNAPKHSVPLDLGLREELSLAVVAGLGPRLDRERFKWSSLAMFSQAMDRLALIIVFPVRLA